MSDKDFADKLKRFSDMMDETRLVMTILQFARSGHATDVMVEQAIALVDRQVVVVKSEGDESLLKTALDLKSGLETALVDGVKSLRRLREPGDDFSFSGLKTSARYYIRDHPEVLEDGRKLRDLCASVQEAIVDVLVTKTIRAAMRLGVDCVTASGGVTCNRALRKALESGCRRKSLTLRLARGSLCTDNAAMIAILAERKLMFQREVTSLDAEIIPGWALA